MKQHRYKKSNLTRHVWLGLAVFLLVFNSTPVKRFIRLSLNQHFLVFNTTAEQVSSPNVKDCTLMERHTVSAEVCSDVQHHANAGDTEYTFVLSLLISAASFLLTAAYYRQRSAYPVHDDPPLAYSTPVYLRHHRLQV